MDVGFWASVSYIKTYDPDGFVVDGARGRWCYFEAEAREWIAEQADLPSQVVVESSVVPYVDGSPAPTSP